MQHLRELPFSQLQTFSSIQTLSIQEYERCQWLWLQTLLAQEEDDWMPSPVVFISFPSL